MNKLLIASVLAVFSFSAASAQWNNNRDNNRYDDRYEARRNDDNRRYDDRYDNRHYDNQNYRFGNRIGDFQREARQRIGDGISRGLITSREARHLMRQVDQIERKENFFWRDRQLDPREYRELMEDLTSLNREISREKRDRDTYDDYGQYNNRRGGGRSW